MCFEFLFGLKIFQTCLIVIFPFLDNDCEKKSNKVYKHFCLNVHRVLKKLGWGGGDGLKKGQLAQFAKILAHFVGDYMEKSHHHVP